MTLTERIEDLRIIGNRLKELGVTDLTICIDVLDTLDGDVVRLEYDEPDDRIPRYIYHGTLDDVIELCAFEERELPNLEGKTIYRFSRNIQSYFGHEEIIKQAASYYVHALSCVATQGKGRYESSTKKMEKLREYMGSDW
jgi:hypothetical protein